MCVYTYLEHGPDVFVVCGRGEGGVYVGHRLHEGLGRHRHVLHLHVV